MILYSLFATFMGCSDNTSEQIDQKTSYVSVQTTSFPVHYLVEQVSKGHKEIEISCILPVGEDAPFWNPDATQVLALQEADLIISNGANFEPFLQKISIEQQKIIDTSKGIQLIQMEGETHSHGKKGAHSHAGVDPHLWLDPKAYIQQARNIKDALIQADQSHRGLYEYGYTKLEDQLQNIHRDILNATTKLRRYEIAANHPAYNYFAKRFSLQIQNFDFDPESAALEEQIQKFQQYVQRVEGNGKPAIVFWESEPSEEAKESLKGNQNPPPNIIHVVFPPLEQPETADTSYDYLKQYQDNIKIIEKLISQLEMLQNK